MLLLVLLDSASTRAEDVEETGNFHAEIPFFTVITVIRVEVFVVWGNS